MTHWGNKMNDLMTIYQKILGIRLNTIDFGSVNMVAQNKWYQTGKISSFFCSFIRSWCAVGCAGVREKSRAKKEGATCPRESCDRVLNREGGGLHQ
eukprot:sb/3479133/